MVWILGFHKIFRCPVTWKYTGVTTDMHDFIFYSDLNRNTILSTVTISTTPLNKPNTRKQIHPQKNRHNRRGRAQHHKLARQLPVSAHVLSHRVGSSRHRRGVHLKNYEPFHIAESQNRSKRRDQKRQKRKLERHGRNDILQITADR